MKKLKLRIANNEMKYDIFGISESFNRALEWRSRGAGMIKRDVSPALRATDYKCPKYVWYKSNETNMNEDKKTKVAMTLDGTYEHSNRVYDVDALAPTMQTCGGGNREPKILTRPHGYYKGEVKEKVAPAVKASAYAENKYLQEPICLNSKVNGKQPSVQDRIYSPEGTSTAITTCFHVNIQEPINAMPKDFRIRKLTPRECFRLMDVDDKDIDTIQAAGISDSQQYKLAGNSIVVNVLTEIFRKLLVDTQNDDRQLRMF